jgi:hypothetical protein
MNLLLSNINLAIIPYGSELSEKRTKILSNLIKENGGKLIDLKESK